MTPIVQITAPNPSSQLGDTSKLGASLSRKRIEAAFGEAPTSTGPLNDDSPTGTVSVSRPIRPKGLRLVAPQPNTQMVSFVTEQRWQGYVTGISGGRFAAVVHEQTEGSDVEEVEFDIEDVAILMRDRIKAGAIFFWDVGFQIDPAGQRIRQSILSFPMIPVHTHRQRLEALERARHRFHELGWGDVDGAKSSG
jgi:hypothetical protein